MSLKTRPEDVIVREFLLAAFPDNRARWTEENRIVNYNENRYLHRGDLHMFVYKFCGKMGLSGYAKKTGLFLAGEEMVDGTKRLNNILDTLYANVGSLYYIYAPATHKLCCEFVEGGGEVNLKNRVYQFIEAYVLRRKLLALQQAISDEDEYEGAESC